jgi:hypothetical protein
MFPSTEEFLATCDRLEGWELVEFLQIPIEDVLQWACEYDFINEENYEDLMDFVGLREDDNEEDDR